jgi:predicted Zn-dependent protease
MSRRGYAISFGLLILFATRFFCGSTARAQAVDHQAALAAYHSGNVLYDECGFAEAAAAYEHAIKLDPQFGPAYHNLALADEMVDRQKALKEWQRFIDVGEKDPDLKFDVARAEARLQIYQTLPTLPEAMQPSRYAPGAGDYYWEVASQAEESLWKTFPVKVDLGSAPQIKWIQGAREAFNIWKAMFPLQQVIHAEEADVQVCWITEPSTIDAAGEEWERPYWSVMGAGVEERRVCNITVSLCGRNWTKDEMRAILLHEIGHALGIKGHSLSKKDIMYWQMQDKARQIYLSTIPLPIFFRSLVKEPSQRDMNTLIRLYNSPGLARRMS